MSVHGGPVYEVTLHVDAEAAGDLDEWLSEHIAAMLSLPGFLDARVFRIDDEPGKVGRVVQYLVESDGRLQEYIAGPAAAMREDTRLKFGANFSVSRRVLREAEDGGDAGTQLSCLNCGYILNGQYCGNCGQRAQSRLISILELVRDAFGDLLDFDSRLWRTLVPLAFRPGTLTLDYLTGKRARYMPPFRMYLVLSLLFFLIAFFDPREKLGFLFEPQPAETGQQEQQEVDAARSEALAELERQGVVTPQEPEKESGGIRFVVGEGGEEATCELGDYDPAEMPPWLGRRLTRERLQVMCERMTAEDGQGLRGFLDKLLENVPAGLFILLPLMAFVLAILYPLSKRYYVEHLLFVVHYHAFVFLALSAQIVLNRLGSMVPSTEVATNVTVFAVSAYIPVYLYKALRRVYGQGGFVTGLKFLLLLLAYVLGLSLILGIIAIFAAFSL